jgi:hypothetical protein
MSSRGGDGDAARAFWTAPPLFMARERLIGAGKSGRHGRAQPFHFFLQMQFFALEAADQIVVGLWPVVFLGYAGFKVVVTSLQTLETGLHAHVASSFFGWNPWAAARRVRTTATKW